jgi:hypothetical protein
MEGTLDRGILSCRGPARCEVHTGEHSDWLDTPSGRPHLHTTDIDCDNSERERERMRSERERKRVALFISHWGNECIYGSLNTMSKILKQINWRL